MPRVFGAVAAASSADCMRCHMHGFTARTMRAATNIPCTQPTNPECCGAGFGTPGAFGTPAAAAPGMGSRAAPYTKTQDIDSQQSAGGQKQTVYFNSISAMPAYLSKSVEELRHEDYAVRSLLQHQRIYLCCQTAFCVHRYASTVVLESSFCKVLHCACIDSSASKGVFGLFQAPPYITDAILSRHA